VNIEFKNIKNLKKTFVSNQEYIDKLLKKDERLGTKIELLSMESGLEICWVVLSNSGWDLGTDSTNEGKFSISSRQLNSIMRLDLAAINALSIFPRLSDFKKMHQLELDTLVGVFDKCKTQIGSRLLRTWLQQPLQDVDQIENRLDMVEML